MIPISPITAETVMPYVGRPVCAVMQDGTRHFGILGGIGEGRLYLHVPSDGLALASLPDKRNRKRTKQAKPDKAYTKAFFGFGLGFGFGALALSLGLLTALFFVPFFI